MAAAATPFSPPMQKLKCTHSPALDHHPNSSSTLILSFPPTSRITTSLNTSTVLEPLAFGAPTSVSWRHSAWVAVASQQEAAVVEESSVESVNEVKEAEEGEGGEGGKTLESGVNTKLYFGNLPYNVDSAQLAGIIQDYASPELVEVLYDRNTGRSRGFAFVTMSTIEDCNAVIENLDGSQYMGRILKVNFSDKPKPKEPLYPETEYKLFIGNLSWSVTSESLEQAFQEYGNVVGARVLFDGKTGKSRGYGFVCYATKSEMETALAALNGLELEGRAMRVSLAQGRKT